MIKNWTWCFGLLLSGCGNSPESIAEELCRCEQVAGDEKDDLEQCRSTAKEAMESFDKDPEAMDKGIRAYHNSGCS